MNSEKAFRYYYRNAEIFRKYDRGLPKWQYNFIVFFYATMHVLGISWLLKKIVIYQIEKKKFNDAEVISVLFALNHKVVDNKIKKMIEIDYPTYDFTGSNVSDGKTAFFSDKFAVLATIANAKNTYKELRAARNNDVLYNNTVRVVKISGYTYIFDHLLENVKVVIKYNDVTHYSVLLYDIAHKKGIKTVYIQHAPVAESFPPLYHDLNVLFSQDSVDKYQIDSSKTIKIITLFDLRFFEVSFKPLSYENSQTVLICPNHHDDLGTVKALAKKISQLYRVILRPHPADKREWGESYFQLSKNRSVWDDISEVKYLLCNESSVLLEGLYAGRLCYKCAFFSRSQDAYGFIRKRLLTKEYNSEENLIFDMKESIASYDITRLPYFIGDIDDADEKCKILKSEISTLARR